MTLPLVVTVPQICHCSTLPAIVLLSRSKYHGLTADTKSRGQRLRPDSATKLNVHQPAAVTVSTAQFYQYGAINRFAAEASEGNPRQRQAHLRNSRRCSNA
jgi:hypothetical protein